MSENGGTKEKSCGVLRGTRHRAAPPAPDVSDAVDDRLLAILNCIADPICIKDRQHNWVIVNDAFCDISGQSRETLIGKSDFEFFPKAEAEVFWEKDEEVFRTGKENVNEESITDSSGVTRTIITKKTLYRDQGGKEFIVAIGRDITERKLAEKALQESEQFMHLIIDTTPAHIFVKDREGRFLLANETAASAHSSTPGQMIGKYEHEFAGGSKIRAKQIAKYRFDDREIIDSQQPRFIPEEMFVTSEGDIRWLQTTKIPLALNGRSEYILGVSVDITDLKRAEAELLEKEELLQQSQKMEAIGRLAGGIAHDFNNLLTAIIGYSDLLKVDGALTAGGVHSVEEIRKAADRAAGLTQQLLAFSRKQVLMPRLIDLNKLILDMEKLLKRLIGENIRLSTHPLAGSALVEADPGKLEQVIVNLVVNARDAMHQGGHITIETQNVKLTEEKFCEQAGVKPGDFVLMSLSDTGHGMDRETLKHIFEPFFTTKKKGQGTGLGLSTVYGIVSQSGGIILVNSEPRKGTSFKVYIPRHEGKMQTAEGERITLAPKTGTELILIVEDEAIVRQMLCRLLKNYGYRVLEASNGSAALDICQKKTNEKIDLLITDVVMPDMSGKELADVVLNEVPGMKVLFISGYTEDAIVHHGVLDSGIEFLQKPFSPDSLALKVRSILDSV